MLYARGLQTLLNSWGLAALHSLGLLADRLGFAPDVCQALEAAMLKAVKHASDAAVAELLLWAHRMQLTALKAELVKQIVVRDKPLPLAAFGDNPLCAVVAELQRALGVKAGGPQSSRAVPRPLMDDSSEESSSEEDSDVEV